MSRPPATATDSDRTPFAWALPSERPDPRAILPAAPEVTAWLAHVDAGRIGVRPAPDPEIVANREATARLFARPPRRCPTARW